MQGEPNIIIDRRFRGPPASGNGGYVAGLVAKAIGGSGCIVTLRAPPPLETMLTLGREGMGARLMAGETLIAAAIPAELAIEVPAPPSGEAAERAKARFSGFEQHVFPGCFVCGPEREEGDGLRIFPGAVGSADGPVAAPWRPDSNLADAEGKLLPEFAWAALDCPGYFAVQQHSGPAVLGRIGVLLHRDIIAGDETVVTGWRISSDGRKHQAGTAIHDSRGRLCAAAEATWIGIATADWEGQG